LIAKLLLNNQFSPLSIIYDMVGVDINQLSVNLKAMLDSATCNAQNQLEHYQVNLILLQGHGGLH